MISSGVGSFTKQAACPSSKTLLSLRSTRLSAEVRKLIEWHLTECDFCGAEVRLLAHHTVPNKAECRPPSMPMNLRLLAEALLNQSKTPPQNKSK